MNLFKFSFRRLEKRSSEIELIETYLVSWYSIINTRDEDYCVIDTKKNVQAFTSKNDANEYASELFSAIKLLGHEGYKVVVSKQVMPTNK